MDDFDDEAPTPGGANWDPNKPRPVDRGTEFLRQILAAPQDFGLRLVYADWLEQRGTPEMARLVRLLTVDPVEGPERAELRELGTHLSNEWIATLARGPIDGCEQETQRPCTQRWEALATTDDPLVRRCAECGFDVRFCPTVYASGLAGDISIRAMHSPLEKEWEALDYYDGGAPPNAEIIRVRRARRLPRSP